MPRTTGGPSSGCSPVPGESLLADSGGRAHLAVDRGGPVPMGCREVGLAQGGLGTAARGRVASVTGLSTGATAQGVGVLTAPASS